MLIVALSILFVGVCEAALLGTPVIFCAIAITCIEFARREHRRASR